MAQTKTMAFDYSSMTRSVAGRKKRKELDKMIAEAGGVVKYMQGTVSRPEIITRKEVKPK